MTKLTVIKVGGKIVEEPESLEHFLDDFAAIKGNKLLVHGGGRSATSLAAKLGIETKMVDGRRITNGEMLRVVTMVYGGLVNKNIVAKLQSKGINALGLTGADMNVILSHKRQANPIDFGFVGDVDKVDAPRLSSLIEAGVVPIMAPLTHNGKGDLLNTNADTIAGEVAKALTAFYDVTLMFCFEKAGVLKNENDESSVIEHITESDYQRLIENKIIQGGMIPKIQNSINALNEGVKEVIITKANAIDGSHGTKITKA